MRQKKSSAMAKPPDASSQRNDAIQQTRQSREIDKSPSYTSTRNPFFFSKISGGQWRPRANCTPAGYQLEIREYDDGTGRVSARDNSGGPESQRALKAWRGPVKNAVQTQ